MRGEEKEKEAGRAKDTRPNARAATGNISPDPKDAVERPEDSSAGPVQAISQRGQDSKPGAGANTETEEEDSTAGKRKTSSAAKKGARLGSIKTGGEKWRAEEGKTKDKTGRQTGRKVRREGWQAVPGSGPEEVKAAGKRPVKQPGPATEQGRKADRKAQGAEQPGGKRDSETEGVSCLKGKKAPQRPQRVRHPSGPRSDAKQRNLGGKGTPTEPPQGKKQLPPSKRLEPREGEGVINPAAMHSRHSRGGAGGGRAMAEKEGKEGNNGIRRGWEEGGRKARRDAGNRSRNGINQMKEEQNLEDQRPNAWRIEGVPAKREPKMHRMRKRGGRTIELPGSCRQTRQDKNQPEAARTRRRVNGSKRQKQERKCLPHAEQRIKLTMTGTRQRDERFGTEGTPKKRQHKRGLYKAGRNPKARRGKSRAARITRRPNKRKKKKKESQKAKQ